MSFEVRQFVVMAMCCGAKQTPHALVSFGPSKCTVECQTCKKLSRFAAIPNETIVVGIDEVGRGSFAGPLVVVAAAFRIPGEWDPTIPCPVANVKDSKKYPSHEARVPVAAALRECPSLVAVGCGQVDASEINIVGMSKAMKVAIATALTGIEQHGIYPDLVLLDGNEKAEGWKGAQKSTPKADNLWWPVSAASVLAKVYRDSLMHEMDKLYPQYGFRGNSGYGTPEHRKVLRELGPCAIHRTSFIRSTMETV